MTLLFRRKAHHTLFINQIKYTHYSCVEHQLHHKHSSFLLNSCCNRYSSLLFRAKRGQPFLKARLETRGTTEPPSSVTMVAPRCFEVPTQLQISSIQFEISLDLICALFYTNKIKTDAPSNVFTKKIWSALKCTQVTQKCTEVYASDKKGNKLTFASSHKWHQIASMRHKSAKKI